MPRDFAREALQAAAESPHAPPCPVARNPVELCTCHVGKARFALDVAAMSAAEHVQLVDEELTPGERVGPTEGYDAAYQRALAKRAKKMGVKL